MASIRELKKDINYLTSEIITEVYVRKVLFSGVKESDVSKIIVDALAFRNDLIERVNARDGRNNAKLVKASFQQLRKDMADRFTALVEAVNELKADKE
jgi:hypothetical protein